MDLKAILSKTIGVRPSHVKTTAVDKATCVVSKVWLSNLVKERNIPGLFTHQDHLTDTECTVLMHRPPTAVSKDSTFITVVRIAKMDKRFVSLRLKEPWTRSHDLGYLELVRYVSETNYRNIWKEANSATSKTADKQDKNFVKLKPIKDYNSAVREIIAHLYNCPIISTSRTDSCQENPEGGQQPLFRRTVPSRRRRSSCCSWSSGNTPSNTVPCSAQRC